MDKSIETDNEHKTSDTTILVEDKELNIASWKPTCLPISSDTIRVAWKALPSTLKAVEVQYKPYDAHNWLTTQTTDDGGYIDVPNLVEDIYYHFRVTFLCDNQEAVTSEMSDLVSTVSIAEINSAAKKYSDDEENSSEPEIYIPTASAQGNVTQCSTRGHRHNEPVNDSEKAPERANMYMVSPSALVCEQMNTDTVKVSWKYSPRSESVLQNYQVCYKDVTEDVGSWQSVSTLGKETSIKISNLNNGRPYIFKVRSVYDTVDGQFSMESDPICLSSELSFLKVDQPRKLEITERQPDSFVVKWVPPAQLSGDIDCYEVKFKQDDPISKKWQSIWTEPNEIKIKISDLRIDTEYIIKVRAMIDGNDGTFSEVIKGKTLTNDSRPSAPKRTASTDRSISFCWRMTKNDLSTKDTCSQLDIRYRSKRDSKRWFTQSIDPFLREFTIENLNPETDYEVKIREVHGDIEGPFSEVANISTESHNFEQNINLNVAIEDTDKASITMTWEKPKVDNKNVDHFEIRYRRNNEKWKARRVEANQSRCAVGGLEPSSLYEIKFRAVIDGIEYPFTDMTAKTKEDTLEQHEMESKPSNISVVEATTDSIELKWEPPTFDPKSIMNYEIRHKSCSDNNDEWKSEHTKECNMKVQKLSPGTKYEIKLRAIYLEMISAFSEIVASTEQINKDIVLLEEQEVSYEYISLFWDKPSGNREADTYLINYRVRPKGKWMHLSTDEQHITVVNLNEGQSYEFKIRAMFDDQEGPLSPSKIIRTLEEPQHVKHRRPGLPRQVEASFDEICIEWDRPADCSELNWYEVRYRGYMSEKWCYDISKENIKKISGLEQSSAYEFKVRAVYSDGCGPFSGISQITTLSEDEVHKNEPPSVPEVVSVGCGHVILKWSQSSSWRKEVQHFKLAYVRKDDIEKEGFQIIQVECLQNEHLIDAMELSTDYQFRVQAVFVDSTVTPFSEWTEFISTAQCVIEGLQVDQLTHDSLRLTWKRPNFHDEIGEYEVLYRENLDGIDEWQCIKVNENSASISYLKDSTEYDVKMRCIFKSGRKSDSFSIVPRPTTKLHPDKKYPGMPKSSTNTTRSITVTWSPPKLKGIGGYEIKYRECGIESRKWMSVSTDNTSTTHRVQDLRNGTDYEFKVAAIINNETGQFSKVSQKMSTKLSLARRLQVNAKMVEGKGPLTMYKLPIVCKTKNASAKTRKCEIDHRLLSQHEDVAKSARWEAERGFVRKVKDAFLFKNTISRNERTLLLIGATGSGKSTLIDGMINYVTDVSWEDDFRFTLIDLTGEEKERLDNQTVSQTDWITTYRIPCFSGGKLDYTVNIIDTPGFGDTRGITRDKELVGQLKDLFESNDENGIQMLDGVCFVTQSSNARLTHTQKYIFDSMLSLFGKNIRDNIFILITFADCTTPPVLDALSKANVPFTYHFKFNNSALFESNQTSDEFSKSFWKMGEDSFKTFFNIVRNVEPKSLQLTADVLRTRSTLEVTIEGIQKQVTDGMNQLNTIRQEAEILKRHKTDISNNRNFSYSVEEAVMEEVKLDAGEYVTNCLNCNLSCHYPCRIDKDENKHKCKAMDRGTSSCTVCPQKCHWSKHRNASFRLETNKQTVSKTYEELKKKFEIAQKEATNQEAVLTKVKSRFLWLRKDVTEKIKAVRKCLNDLDRYALHPNPLSDVDYIDLLIQSEEHEMKYDWENRVKLLKDFRAEAQMIKEVKTGELEPFKKVTDEVLRSFDINFD